MIQCNNNYRHWNKYKR